MFQPEKTHVESLEIILNGKKVVNEKDFDDRRGQLILSVPLKASNQIQVLARGRKGSYVTIQIDRVMQANLPPIASFTSTPGTANAPLLFSFDGSASSDPDGTIQSFSWDFSDGQQASGTQVSHLFSGNGTYNVTLTVTDNLGSQNSVVKSVVVQDVTPPVLTISSPVSGAIFTSASFPISASSN